MTEFSNERHLIVEFNSKPQNIDAVRELLLRFIGPARREDGCLYYDLYQTPSTPTKFFILDGWRDQTAIEAHGVSPNVTSVLKELLPLLDKPPSIVTNERISDNPSPTQSPA